MKIDNKCIIGNFIELSNVTKGWTEVEVSLVDAEIYPEKYLSIANKSKGYFADLFDGITPVLRFQDPADATRFNKEYYNGITIY